MNNKVKGFRYGDLVKIVQEGFYEGVVGRVVGRSYGSSKTLTVLLEYGDKAVVEEREVEKVNKDIPTVDEYASYGYMSGSSQSGAV